MLIRILIQLFDILFNAKFRHLLQQSDQNILSMMTCGSVISHQSSKKALSNFASL
jgi:hypothetical protein